jgi:hypothetical protein
MEPIPQIKKPNPLSTYMRQPKIYIQLPSNGKWWEPGSLVLSENGEYPVYSMTAKDELMFKTPDALLNGQALVDVIQSCMPNIKNAWAIPSIDLDVILIALRFATYGDKMGISHKIPVIDEEVEHQLDLKILLSQLQSADWIEQIAISSDFIVFVKPLTYKHVSLASIKTFETTRILDVVNNDKITEEKKIEIFNESFGKLTNVTIDLVADSVYKVVTAEGEVTDKPFIKEFIVNADKDIFQKIQNHLTEMKNKYEIKPLTFTTTEDQQLKGAPATYTVPITFNQSDFFDRGF